MTLRLNGSTSGYTEIDAPAVAGNNNLKLPTGNGSDGNILGTDGAGNLSWVNGRMVLATSQASTSGTAIDFTGIPSWAKRVTVMFNGMGTNGTSLVQVQLGTSSGIETTNYFSQATSITGTAAASTTYTTGIVVVGVTANVSRCGSVVISLFGANAWSYVGTTGISQTGAMAFLSGVKAVSATLDRIRITTGNGTDTFNAGAINILYEG